MNVTAPNINPDQQRRAVRRTVWILFACAVASYALFFYTTTHS